MSGKKNIFVIIGSASKDSSNVRLVEHLKRLSEDELSFQVFEDLKTLPHFDPELSSNNPPRLIQDFIESISRAEGVIICTPEYVFSIPSGLKNALEWCVATTVFSGKPTGLITASAHGQKGHEELQLIMNTLTARFIDDTTLLVQGVKGKIDREGKITNEKLAADLHQFINAFKKLFS